MTEETNYCYSTNEEYFTRCDFSEILYELRDNVSSNEELIGQTYYRGDVIPIQYSDCIDIESILEDCDQRAYEEIGEIYDNDFTGVSEEAKQELLSLLEEWSKKHINFGYRKVENVVELKIEEGDL